MQPSPPSIPPIQIPTYRAEVPLVAALPAQFRQPDLAMLGNLHRRMGDEDPAIGARAATGTASGPSGSGTRRAWAASCIPTSTSSNRVSLSPTAMAT